MLCGIYSVINLRTWYNIFTMKENFKTILLWTVPLPLLLRHVKQKRTGCKETCKTEITPSLCVPYVSTLHVTMVKNEVSTIHRSVVLNFFFQFDALCACTACKLSNSMSLLYKSLLPHSIVTKSRITVAGVIYRSDRNNKPLQQRLYTAVKKILHIT